MKIPIKWPSGLIEYVTITRDGADALITVPLGKQQIRLPMDKVMEALK